jgi:hypothetical protein
VFYTILSGAVLCCSSLSLPPTPLWLKTLAVVHHSAVFKGRQSSLPLRDSSRNWSTGSHRRPVDRTFVANRGSIGEAESEWECYPDTEVPRSPCDFSLAGSGDRGLLSGAFNDPSTCCNGSRFGSIFASIARPSKHGSHHVCDNRVPSARPPQGERLCLILRNLARQSNPTHGDGHWLALPARIGFIRLPISADSAVYQSLFGERAVIPSAPIAGVECSQVHAWTISSKTPTMANNNQRDDSGSGEQ